MEVNVTLALLHTSSLFGFLILSPGEGLAAGGQGCAGEAGRGRAAVLQGAAGEEGQSIGTVGNPIGRVTLI